MSGERDGDDREARDYAGKEGGHSGGPGGHARERLDELIAQRVPSSEEEGDQLEAERDGDRDQAEETQIPLDEPEHDENQPESGPAAEAPDASSTDEPDEEGEQR